MVHSKGCQYYQQELPPSQHMKKPSLSKVHSSQKNNEESVMNSTENVSQNGDTMNEESMVMTNNKQRRNRPKRDQMKQEGNKDETEEKIKLGREGKKNKIRHE